MQNLFNELHFLDYRDDYKSVAFDQFQLKQTFQSSLDD